MDVPIVGRRCVLCAGASTTASITGTKNKGANMSWREQAGMTYDKCLGKISIKSKTFALEQLARAIWMLSSETTYTNKEIVEKVDVDGLVTCMVQVAKNINTEKDKLN